MIPRTRKTFSVVTTTRVRSQRTTATSAVSGRDRLDERAGDGSRPGQDEQDDTRHREQHRARERPEEHHAVPARVEAHVLFGTDSHARTASARTAAIPALKTFGYRRKVERLDLRRNWPAAVLAVAAVVLIPWAIALGQMLPSRHVANHWDAAWTGFDVILAFSLLATA